MVNEQAEAGLLQFARFSRLDGPGDKLQSRIAEIEKQLGAMLFDLAYIKRTRKLVSLEERKVLFNRLDEVTRAEWKKASCRRRPRQLSHIPRAMRVRLRADELFYACV
jgi:hypothetical protein